jgi:hypothetical protein
MSTTVDTTTNASTIAYTNQRKIDRCQNGNIWVAVCDSSGSNGPLYYSTDNGATWTKIANQIDGFNGSMFIDLDDYLHWVFKGSDNKVYYRRAVPNAGRTAWTWDAVQTVCATAGLGNYPDVISMRDPAGGGGFVTHIVWSYVNGTTVETDYDKYTITSGGAYTHAVVNQAIGSGYATSHDTFPSIDFQHNGDGKTAVANPALFVAWTAGGSGAGKGMRFRKAVYSAGAWSWNTEREISSTDYIPNTNNNMWVQVLFNGSDPYIVYTGYTSLYYTKIFKRDLADTTTTSIYDSGSLGGTNGAFSGGASCDTNNIIYILGGSYDNSRLNLYTYNLNTSSVTITNLGSQTASIPHFSVKRTKNNSRVEWINMDGTVSPFNIKYTSLLAITTSRTFKWNVKAAISLSRIFKWNVRTAVSTITRTFKWNVRTAVSTITRTFKWNVIGGVLINRVFKWNVLQTITPTRTFKWNVRVAVTPFTRTFKWNVLQQVSLNRIFKWNVIQTIVTSRVFKWNVQQVLSISRTFKWNVTGFVNITRTYLWDVFAPWTKVSKPVDDWTEIPEPVDIWTEIERVNTGWR